MNVIKKINEESIILHVPHGGSNYYVEFATIGPEEAKELLEKNHSNQRDITKSKLNKLKKELRAGRWVFNGETIKLTKSNKLIDGQYRLTAIIETGIPMTLLIVHGLDDITETGVDVFSTIDSSSRTEKDILKIAGFDYKPAKVAKLVRLATGFNEQILKSKAHGQKYLNSELVEVAEAFNKNRMSEVIDLAEERVKNNKEGIPLEGWLLLTYLEDRIPDMAGFIEQLEVQSVDNVGNPASMLLRFFANKRGGVNTNGGLMRNGAWFAVFGAFDKYVNNENMRIAAIPSSRRPIPYPKDYADYDA